MTQTFKSQTFTWKQWKPCDSNYQTISLSTWFYKI